MIPLKIMDYIQSEVIVIGISGVSCGGKTTIANKLLKCFNEDIPCVLCKFDDYYKDEEDISVDPKTGLLEWDVLNAFALDRFHRDVLSHIKELESKKIASKVFLIVEGILLYQDSFLDDIFNKRYFLTLPYEIARQRRSLRVYDPPDVPALFDKHVWPMYVEYRDRIREKGIDMVEIDSSQPIDHVFCALLNDIKHSFLIEV